MNKVSFTAGAVVGTLVGAAVGMMLDPVKDKHNKNMKKTAGRAFRNLGSVIDGVLDMKF
jgi:gas vesicle protein